MELSALAAGIAGSDYMKARISAIVKAAWWKDVVDDGAAAVPLEELAWAVASNDAIRTTVAGAGELNTVENGVRLVTDQDLEYVILSVALPRLTAADAAPTP